MDEVERYRHQLYAQLPAFKRKVDWTRQIIEDAFEKGGHWHLSFSGGVDSTVLLDLLFQTGHAFDVRYVDDGWDYEDTMTFLAETEQRYGFRLLRYRSLHNWREWCLEMGRPDLAADPAALEAWGNPRQWDGGWKTHEEWLESLEDYNGVFLGLLAKESRGRNYQLHSGFRPLYQVKAEHGLWHCSPLAAWTKRDIWAWIVSRELPYNAAYDKLAAMGIPLERRRVAPLTCFMVMQYGSHGWVLRSGWPELYNRLAETFPTIRTYS